MQDYKFGVLLVNLGTPKAPDTKAVRTFLKQFLSDSRVVDLSPWIWKPLLNLVILNVRPPKVAKLYKSIWTQAGSPLMDISLRQKQKLQLALGEDILVELAMSYGEPSIAKTMEDMQQKVEKIFVLPLYPQYSCSTVAPVFDAIANYLKTVRNLPEIIFNKDYHVDPLYIKALADSVRTSWQNNGRAQKLVFSFHGIPKRYADQGDPYKIQCVGTAEAVALELELTENDYIICFQSRFGKEEWLTPYTDKVLEELAQNGASVDVISPAFACDCLETLEELAKENKELFIDSGGKTYNFVPCLNDSEAHIDMFYNIVKQKTKGWS